jgi:hypothetical protein
MEPRKQHNDFVISLAGESVDTTIVTIEEMQGYCDLRKRMAIVGTEKKTYGELDKMNYQLVSNYTKPKCMAVNTKSKPYLDVYTYLLNKYKGGLIVIEGDTLSDPIADLICNSDRLAVNDIDIIICRNGFASMTDDEMKKANFLRIHADPDMNPLVFQKLGEFYQEKILALMIAQFFANDQYNELNTYFETHNEKYVKHGFTDFVDYYELNKQLSYFVYFDVVNNKILNIDKDTLAAFMIKMKGQGLLPIPDGEIPVAAESLTIEQ